MNPPDRDWKSSPHVPSAAVDGLPRGVVLRSSGVVALVWLLSAAVPAACGFPRFQPPLWRIEMGAARKKHGKFFPSDQATREMGGIKSIVKSESSALRLHFQTRTQMVLTKHCNLRTDRVPCDVLFSLVLSGDIRFVRRLGVYEAPTTVENGAEFHDSKMLFTGLRRLQLTTYKGIFIHVPVKLITYNIAMSIPGFKISRIA